MTMKTEVVSGALRARLSRADRPELEQGLLRAFLAGIIVAYVAWDTMATRYPTVGAGVLPIVWSYFAAALVILLAMSARPGPSATRRVLEIVVDVTAATYALWAMGEGGVVIFGVYLFIILGNGFRYGRKYLHITQALSIVGFAFVMVQAPWWNAHLLVGMGMLQILIVIPFYVGVLAERLKAALLNAQQALEECRRNQGCGGPEQSSEASKS